MHWILFTVLLGSWFPDGTVVADRVKKLKPLFSPPPGTLVTLDSRQIRDQSKTAHPLHLKGYINVSPPKGVCLILNRGVDYTDIRVCKEKMISFRLGDISREGDLKWTVHTGPDDFGTQIEWPTPYRVAYVVKNNKDPSSAPEYKYLVDCKATVDSEGARTISVSLLDGDQWYISFPDRDQLLPQPPEGPNLTMRGVGSNRISVTEASKDPATREKLKDGGTEKIDFKADRKEWHLPMKKSYVMGADRFRTKGDVPQGMKGVCRYRFFGGRDDPEVGRVECHGIDNYHFLLVPLSCMQAIGGPRT